MEKKYINSNVLIRLESVSNRLQVGTLAHTHQHGNVYKSISLFNESVNIPTMHVKGAQI